MENASFTIEWFLKERSWQDALEAFYRNPPSYGEETGSDVGLFYLPARIQMRYGDHVLFPADRLQALWTETYMRRVQALPLPARKRDLRRLTQTIETQGFSLSIVDLAQQLAPVLTWTVDTPARDLVGVHNSGVGFSIGVERVDDHVHITSAIFRDIRLVIPVDRFQVGVQTFLVSFSGAIQDRAPELFEWEAMSWLRSWTGHE